MTDRSKLTFIGKAEADKPELDLLHLFGRALWRSGVEVTIVPKGMSNDAVIAGIEHEHGVARRIGNAALSAPRDGLVIYADDALLAAIKKTEPTLDLDADAIVITKIEELQQYVEAMLAEV